MNSLIEPIGYEQGMSSHMRATSRAMSDEMLRMRQQMSRMQQMSVQDTQSFSAHMNNAMAMNDMSSSSFNVQNVNNAVRMEQVKSAVEAGNNFDSTPSVAMQEPNTSAYNRVSGFRSMMENAFENVNVLQNQSSSMAQRFDVGDRSVTLADVMMASQKAGISFEATMQVRNKMVEAYKTITQMQI